MGDEIDTPEGLVQGDYADDYNDETEMPFGMHCGTALGDLPDSYIQWLFEEEWIYDEHPKLHDYCFNRLQTLNMRQQR